MTAIGGNKSFLVKVINRAQRDTVESPFGMALTEYCIRAGVLAWDDDRALFWVEHPVDGWQVAVWLMPVAAHFQPQARA